MMTSTAVIFFTTTFMKRSLRWRAFVMTSRRQASCVMLSIPLWNSAPSEDLTYDDDRRRGGGFFALRHILHLGLLFGAEGWPPGWFYRWRAPWAAYRLPASL